MSKNKLAKFAEMEHYPHVFQAGSIATATLAVDKGAVICGGLTIKE